MLITRPSKATGVVNYGPQSSDPSSPTPSDGDVYYNTVLDKWMFYDGGRSKWLSQETLTINFGKQGSIAVGSYFRGPDNIMMSATIGFHAVFDGTVISLGYTRSDTDAATFEVVQDGTSVSTLASSAVSGRDNTLNDDFTQGDVLAVKNQSGGNVMSNVNGWVLIKWRA